MVAAGSSGDDVVGSEVIAMRQVAWSPETWNISQSFAAGLSRIKRVAMALVHCSVLQGL